MYRLIVLNVMLTLEKLHIIKNALQSKIDELLSEYKDTQNKYIISDSTPKYQAELQHRIVIIKNKVFELRENLNKIDKLFNEMLELELEQILKANK